MIGEKITFLLLLARSISGLSQIAQMNNIVFSYDETARIDLDDFFIGQNMSFTVNSGGLVKQGLDLVSRTNITSSIDLARDPTRNYIYTLNKREFIVWKYDGEMAMSKISSTKLSLTNTAANIQCFTFNSETFIAIIGNGFNSLFVNLYNATSISSISIVGSTSVKNYSIKRSYIYTGYEAYLFANSDSILVFQLLPSIGFHSEITDQQLGIRKLNTLELIFHDEIGILCDSKLGLLSFNVENYLDDTNKTIETNIQGDPLSYGSIYSCTVQSNNLTVGTSLGLVSYSLPGLSYIQKYYKLTQDDYSKISHIQSFSHFILGFFKTKRERTIRLTDTLKPLNQSVVFDIKADIKDDKFLVISIEDTTYAVFQAFDDLHIYNVNLDHYLEIPAQTSPFTSQGNLIVSDANRDLSASFEANGIDPKGMEIRPWRGMFRPLNQYYSLKVFYTDNPLQIPLSMYFGGQNVEYSLTLETPPKFYNIKIQNKPKIEKISTFSIPSKAGNSLFLDSVLYFVNSFILAVPGTSPEAYLLFEAEAGSITLLETLKCEKAGMQASRGAFTSINNQLYILLECQSSALDLDWQFYSYNNKLETIGSYTNLHYTSYKKILFLCNHVLVLSGPSIYVYEFSPASNPFITLAYPLNKASINGPLPFEPADLAPGENCDTLYVYNVDSDIMKINMGNWEPPYDYSVIEFATSDPSSVQLNYHNYRLYVNAEQGDSGFSIYEIDTITQKTVRKFPDFLSENYYALASSDQFLYLLQASASDADLYIWDPNEFTFDGLFKVLSFPGTIAITLSGYNQNIFYIYYKDKLESYSVSHGENSDNLFASVNLEYNSVRSEVMDDCSLKVSAENSFETMASILNVTIYSNGFNIMPNSAYDPKSSLLTDETKVFIKTNITERIPQNAFVGNSIEFSLYSKEKVYYGADQCTEPICIEGKGNSLEVLLENAYDFTHNSESIFVSVLNYIEEYDIASFKLVQKYSLSSLFEVESIDCYKIEKVPVFVKTFVVSCVAEKSFIAIVDLNNGKVSNLVDDYLSSYIFTVNSTYIYSFDQAKIQVFSVQAYGTNSKYIDLDYIITGNSLNLASFTVIGMHTLQSYLVLVLESAIAILKSGEIVDILGVSCTLDYKTTPKLRSSFMSNSTIHALDQSGFVYTIEIAGLKLTQTNVLPPIHNENDNWVSSIGFSPLHNLLVYPVSYDKSLKIRSSYIERPINNYIYDDFYVSPFSTSDNVFARTLVIENSEEVSVIFLAQSAQKSLTSIRKFNINLNPMVQFTVSDYKSTLLQLQASNGLTTTRIGKVDVKFSEDSAAGNVSEKWWFWFIIILCLVIIVLVVLFLVLWIKKRRSEKYMRLLSLSQNFGTINNEV